MRKSIVLALAALAAAAGGAPAAAQSYGDPLVIPAPDGVPDVTTPRPSGRSGATVRGSRPTITTREPIEEPNLGGGFIEYLFTGGEDMPRRRPRVDPRTVAPGAGGPAYAAPEPIDGYEPDEPVYRTTRPLYGPTPNDVYGTPDGPISGPTGRRRGIVLPEERRTRTAAIAAPTTRARGGVAPEFRKTVVPYDGAEKPGTIVIDTSSRHLYLVQDDGTALRYGIGVGREGFTWRGTHPITRKAEWPDWRPPAEMLKRRPDLPKFMAGGPSNPLGARAMYLGSTLYRIHGSNEPWTIGHAVSSGCIRMTNDDVADLYERVKVGTRVIVR